MQGIISYHRDDFYEINDKRFKAGKYIGKIKTIKPNEVSLIIYLFPEDTKEGRKQHMSQYEIFLTNYEILYKFIGEESLVSVTDLPNYIKRKYIQKENLSSRKLYFQRQIYLENGQFLPSLQKICYCQKYFNPDNNFKICCCGNYFHPMCFIRGETNKCWNKNCSFDCSVYFSADINFDNKNKLSQSIVENPGSTSQTKKSVIMNESIFLNNKLNDTNYKNEPDSDEINNSEMVKKSKQESLSSNITTIEKFLSKIHLEDKEKKNKQDSNINLGFKSEKKLNGNNPTKFFETTIFEKKNTNGNQTLIKVLRNYQEEAKKRIDAERERTRKIVFENLINGTKILQNNTKILDDFEKEKPNLKDNISLIRDNNSASIETYYKELSKSIEHNLFDNCDKKVNSTYFAFLQEFALLIKNSQKLLFRVILGDLTSEEISKFKGDDFLPEEKRKEKEELKQKEIQKMKFEGPMKIQAISNKGRMLTEIQDIIDVNKNINYNINYNMDTPKGEDIEEKQFLPDGKNNPKYEYRQKMKLMQENFPNLSESDIKFMVEYQEPNENDIQNKLNSIIQENLGLDDMKELFNFRRQQLMKKAEKYYKKGKDIDNKVCLEKNVEKYIQDNSFALKFY